MPRTLDISNMNFHMMIPVDNSDQTALLGRMFAGLVGDSAPSDWGKQLHCPVCEASEHGYVHVEETISKGGDDYTAWQGRGAADRIRMWCELGGHRWVLRFGFHKGNTFVAVEEIFEYTDRFDLWLEAIKSVAPDIQKYMNTRE